MLQIVMHLVSAIVFVLPFFTYFSDIWDGGVAWACLNPATGAGSVVAILCSGFAFVSLVRLFCLPRRLSLPLELYLLHLLPLDEIESLSQLSNCRLFIRPWPPASVGSNPLFRWISIFSSSRICLISSCFFASSATSSS